MLLAIGVSAALLSPGVIDFGKRDAPTVKPHRVQVKQPRLRPLPMRHPFQSSYSIGPILELIDQALDLDPFELRRPVRLPSARPQRDRGDGILLGSPGGFRPTMIAARAAPLPHAPPRGIPPIPVAVPKPLGDWRLPWDTFDPDLLRDDPFDDVEDGIFPPAVVVPEPGVPLMLVAPMLGLAWRRRRSA